MNVECFAQRVNAFSEGIQQYDGELGLRISKLLLEKRNLHPQLTEAASYTIVQRTLTFLSLQASHEGSFLRCL